MPIDSQNCDVLAIDRHSLSAVDLQEPQVLSARADGRLVFGTFLIDEAEFGLAVQDIREVVNEPPHFNRILPSPDYFRGVFNLRGLVIPVVDLRLLLGLPPELQDRAGRKVAIIEHGPYCFGLLVDATGEVFTAQGFQHHPFTFSSGDFALTIVKGVFLRDHGMRTVQILDPQKLLNFEQIPKVQASPALVSSEKRLSRRRQCLSFYVGDCACAIDMTCIKEVIDFVGIKNSTLASLWTLGTIDLRGTTVPVIDLGAFLNDTHTTLTENFVGKGFKLIVLRVGTELLSFLVDSITTIVPFHDEDVVRLPPVGFRRAEMLNGGLTMQNASMIFLMDHRKLSDDPNLLHVSEGLGKLFRAHDATIRSDEALSSKKTKYITFSIEGEYALDIRQVKEVLNFPTLITRPPNSQPFIEGVVNLRGDLIPIINPRRLYNLEAVETSSTRLMILSCNGAKYGFMVDKVGSIISVAVADARPMEPFIGRQRGEDIINDVKEWLFSAEADSFSQPLSVLDLSKVLLRCSGVSIGTQS